MEDNFLKGNNESLHKEVKENPLLRAAAEKGVQWSEDEQNTERVEIVHQYQALKFG